MSMYHCTMCDLWFEAGIENPECVCCTRQGSVCESMHLLVPRAELEELVRALEKACKTFDPTNRETPRVHAELAAKFRAKYLETKQ